MIKIKDYSIDNESKTFIIGEISANHNGKIENAKKLIREAKKAGCDAIKLQTYTADTITLNCDNEYFQIKQGTLWDGTTLYKLYQQASLPWEWHKELMEVADEEGIICFSTPFDKTAVDFLETLNVPAYKVASFEITDIPLIEYIAAKGKPIIMSTGIATLSDIQEALDACKRMNNNEVILLKCTSAYPAPYEEMNLKTIPNMKETFHTMVGLSDHSMGYAVAVGAVALGAKVIEKHIILDRSEGGPDASFSMEIHELKEMVDNIRNMEKALGTVSYTLSEKSLKSREFSRSLFISNDIKKGEIFTEKNVKSVRPAYGLHTRYLKDVLGKVAVEDLKMGTPLAWKYFK